MEIGLSNYIHENIIEENLIKEKNINYVFTSLHINEQIDNCFKEKVIKRLSSLKSMGIKIIADISPIGFQSLGISVNNMPNWFKKLFDYLRLDYGFNREEMIVIGNQVNICLNASTMDPIEISKIDNLTSKKVQPFHNFYPKVFSGLDRKHFTEINKKLKNMGYQIFAFIPGDIKRGPIREGLPTLEEHRYATPQYAFLDFKHNLNVDVCFFGDAITSQHIKNILIKDIIAIDLEDKINYFGKLNLRKDKSSYIARIVESRKNMINSKNIFPETLKHFKKGDVVIDNNRNKRYVGEVQIILNDLSSDKFNKISQLKDSSIVNFINYYNKIEIC